MTRLIIFLFLGFEIGISEIIPVGQLEHLVGTRATSTKKFIWDKKFSVNSYIYGKDPAKYLTRVAQLIPKKKKRISKVLDIGMAEGRNAVYVASMGHDVMGIDISSVAINKALRLAEEKSVSIKTKQVALEHASFTPESFDAILCFYYVDRSQNKKILSWLKPGGIIIFESHTLEKKKSFPHLFKDPDDFYLKSGELLSMFPGLKILSFEELGKVNQYRSSIVLQKN